MTTNSTAPFYDCVIVGAGLAGLIATAALRQAGYQVLCTGPAPKTGSSDRRTTALLNGSVHFINHNLDLWDQLEPFSSPLRTLRLIDRTGRLFRAPDTVFQASELGRDAFGYNIPNSDMISILLAYLGDAFLPSQGVTSLHAEENAAYLTLSEGQTLQTKLVIGADGRKSICRENAGIGVRSWTYDQTAIVCNFSHSRPHGGACTEFHYASGPFTIVPLPGQASSLVWVERNETAANFVDLDNASMARELSERLERLLGRITEIGPRSTFPLSALVARRLTSKRLALIGEAAHVMPPIGAQGLNLGIRDVDSLVRCVSGHADPGSKKALDSYERDRRGDVWLRTMAADLLNRTLISNTPLFQFARSAGLGLLDLAGPLRREAMRRGMASTSP